jgi:diguanylate cyclase (GGDEF)-like protein
MVPPPSLRQSPRLLRRLLFSYWLGCSLLLAVGLALFDLWEHQRQIVKEGEQAAQVVSASLRTNLTNQQRQQLLQAYGQMYQAERFDRMNLLLVVDLTGQVVYTSQPAWRSLLISDPLFYKLALNDFDFGNVVECFRDRPKECMEIRSLNWHLPLSGITVVRPVSMPALDLGLPRRPFLVLVNFDSGTMISDLLQDLPVLIVWVCLVSSLLVLALWFCATRQFLPQLIAASQTDSLTQLINRTSFMEKAVDVLAEAEERRAEFVFAILDIDHFKRINDTYGHGCGDAALAAVGALLLAVTRPDDLVCRMGGEEFALLLSMPRLGGAKALERLRLQLEMNRILYSGQQVPLTASIGAAATSDCGYNIDFLYNAADKALYVAKNAGRNLVQWNDGELMSRLSISDAPSAATSN